MANENISLEEEIVALKNSTNDRNSASNNADRNKRHYGSKEIKRSRSLVISVIPDSYDNKASKNFRAYECVERILDYLDIACVTISFCRRGKMNSRNTKLVKVIVPASLFKKEVLKQASMLK